MSLRLPTANENHWGAGGHDFSRAAAETHLQAALAAEGYPSALGYVSAPQGLKPHLNTLRDGTTEVVPSRTRKAYFHSRHGGHGDFHGGIRVLPCLSVCSVSPW